MDHILETKRDRLKRIHHDYVYKETDEGKKLVEIDYSDFLFLISEAFDCGHWRDQTMYLDSRLTSVNQDLMQTLQLLQQENNMLRAKSLTLDDLTSDS